MKIISKETLDEIIRLTKKYNKTGDVDILPKKHEKAFQLSKEAFGKNDRWISFTDLTKAALDLKDTVTSEEIYSLFKILGLEVSETEQEHDE